MKLILGKEVIEWTTPVVMSIINVTPDSFYRGSQTFRRESIIQRTEQAVQEGAALIDIGGYSSRPGAEPVSPQEELGRLCRGMEVIRKRFPQIPVSVDTFRSDVLRQIVHNFGPCIVNDISAGEADPQILNVTAQYNLPYIAMHMRGTPQTMQQHIQYYNLIEELHLYFLQKTEALHHTGIQQILLDPGFGFAKTTEQNFLLLGQLQTVFEGIIYPFLTGLSRKSMIYKTLRTTPEEALTGTTALHWECLRQGASILRVHDTRPATEVVKLFVQFSQSIPQS